MSAEQVGSSRVDAHCHVDLYKGGHERLVREIVERSIETIAVTNAPSVYFFTRQVAEATPLLHAAAGLHPELVHSHVHELPALLNLLEETRFVGEIGLDYQTPDHKLREEQRHVFGTVLERCAALRGKIITVHSRRAAPDVISMIGAGYPGSVILHWFSGTQRDLRTAIAHGLLFSVNVAMTRSRAGLALLREMPPDQILTESDGPFVETKGTPATPSSVEEVLRVIAGLWRQSIEEVAAKVLGNFRRAVGEVRSATGS